MPFTPPPPIRFQHVQPYCLSLPLGITRFSVTVPASPQRGIDASSVELKLEATLNGIAKPIRAASHPHVPQLSQTTRFHDSARLSVNSAGNNDLIILEVDVDLNQASPGLLVFNIWSTSAPSGSLLTSGCALLLAQEEGYVLGDLTDEACGGEDLLSDLADILDASSASSQHTSAVPPLSILLDAAEDILKWSRDEGRASLERLILDKAQVLRQRLNANKAASGGESQAASIGTNSDQPAPWGSGPGSGPGSGSVEHPPKLDVCNVTCGSAVKPQDPWDRKQFHLICWSVMQVTGNLVVAIWKSMTRGKGWSLR